MIRGKWECSVCGPVDKIIYVVKLGKCFCEPHLPTTCPQDPVGTRSARPRAEVAPCRYHSESKSLKQT